MRVDLLALPNLTSLGFSAYQANLFGMLSARRCDSGRHAIRSSNSYPTDMSRDIFKLALWLTYLSSSALSQTSSATTGSAASSATTSSDSKTTQEKPGDVSLWPIALMPIIAGGGILFFISIDVIIKLFFMDARSSTDTKIRRVLPKMKIGKEDKGGDDTEQLDPDDDKSSISKSSLNEKK